MKKIKRNLVLFFLALIGVAPVSASFDSFKVPSSSSIRKEILDDWLLSSLEELRTKAPEIHRNETGQEFQVRLEETDDFFAVIIAPKVEAEVEVYTENGMEVRMADEYPADSSGSWVLIKDSKTGQIEKIKMYFSANSNMYIQFSPEKTALGKESKKTLGDFIIDDLYACKGVKIGIPVEFLYTTSFRDVFLMTEKTFPWKYADCQKGQFHSKFQMIGVIRKNMGRFVYLEDSCFDEKGELINISDGQKKNLQGEEIENLKDKLPLDDAGFLKWVIDGLVIPVAGNGLYRQPLVVQTMKYNSVGLGGILDEKIDLSFTLDWCRNLAAAAFSLSSGRNYFWNEAGVDVNIEPFSSVVCDEGNSQTPGYIKNSGYKISILPALLQVLASLEPSYCYLAAVKTSFREQDLPEFFAFNKCALLLPFYDDSGLFNCVVFEGGKEFTLKSFIESNENAFVHLSRVLASSKFYPEP